MKKLLVLILLYGSLLVSVCWIGCESRNSGNGSANDQQNESPVETNTEAVLENTPRDSVFSTGGDSINMYPSDPKK